jgi:hypothetical protein
MVAIPGPYIETVSVSEVAVILLGPAEASDRDGAVNKVPLAWTSGDLLEIDKSGMSSTEQDVTDLGLPMDVASW